MVRIAICDDEESIVKKIERFVIEYAKGKDLDVKIDCYTKPFELLAKSNSYELIFLDIDMPEANGIEIGKKIKEKNSKTGIIYVTSYSDYAYRSFEVRPFGYVLKPFSREDIFKELNDYIRKKNKIRVSEKINISDGKVTLNLNVDDILYFEYASDKHVDVVVENKKHAMRCSLKYFYDKVRTYGFTYSHKSFIVNMLHIEEIDHFELKMKNNIAIPIAQKKKPQFMKEYNMFLQNAFEEGK